MPLRDAISVQLVPNTMILEIDASNHVPKVARDWANQVATSFITYERTTAIEQVAVSTADITKRIDGLQSQMAAAGSSATSSTAVASLTSQIGALQTELQSLPGVAALSTGGGSVIVPASMPTLPITPKTRQNVALGGILGLLLAGGLVLLMESLDDRLRSNDEIELRAGAPTLGSVPYTKELSAKTPSTSIVHQPSSIVAEAYRTLRTNLGFLSVERPLRTILVTSSVKGEGKSTTSANLAAAFALSGVKTILVSADLRRPSVHKFFGLPNTEGLVDALHPDARVETLLQQNALPDFRLLAAGRIPPNPTEILASTRFARILTVLREAADLVIIDSPPLLGVADASALASRVDGVLLVVNPKEVDRRTFTHATEQLRKAGGRLLGTVMNAVGPGQGYGYGYDYDYYYYAEDKNRANRKARKQRKQQENAGAKRARKAAKDKATETIDEPMRENEPVHLEMPWGAAGIPDPQPVLVPPEENRQSDPNDIWHGNGTAAEHVNPDGNPPDGPQTRAPARGNFPRPSVLPLPAEHD
jgi:capsular exopolysaccharide synthesis family protein